VAVIFPAHMNRLTIGLADKTEDLYAKQGFLLIDDGPIADPSHTPAHQA
jgi:hypothetical protein